MNRRLKYALYFILVLLIVLQFIPVDRSVPTTNPNEEFFSVVNASPEVETLVKQACYDCHSYETVYPWYDKIAPVKFFLNKHIKEGRDELNFSVWTTYPADRASHKAEEAVELVENREMPLNSYTWTHDEARLSDPQRELLVHFFNTLVDPTTE